MAVIAGPNVFSLPVILVPTNASSAWTIIIIEAAAISHEFDRLIKGTIQIANIAILLELAYIALTLEFLSELRYATIEKPRLVSALANVMRAHIKKPELMYLY